MWRSRTFTFVLPAKGSPTTTRPRKTDWSCAATGPTPARAAPSSTVAPPARSDGSPDGNMSAFSRRCSAGSTSIRRRCARGARRSTCPRTLASSSMTARVAESGLSLSPEIAACSVLTVRGWCLGGEEFRQELLEQVDTRSGPSHYGEAVQEAEGVQAERLVVAGGYR